MCDVGRNGGVCYRSCEGRVTITNVSSFGAVGSRQQSSVDSHHHIYCLWILTVFDTWDDLPTDRDTVMSIALTLPKDNLNTTCLKVSGCSLVKLTLTGVDVIILKVDSMSVHTYVRISVRPQKVFPIRMKWSVCRSRSMSDA